MMGGVVGVDTVTITVEGTGDTYQPPVIVNISVDPNFVGDVVVETGTGDIDDILIEITTQSNKADTISKHKAMLDD